MKKIISIGTLVVASSISMLAAASSDNTITFHGAVAASTCRVLVNSSDSPSPIVLLPTINVSHFSAPNGVAGETSFTISVEDCPPSAADTPMDLELAAVGISEQGFLANTGTATGVSLQFLEDSPGGSSIDFMTNPKVVDGLVLRAGETSASHTYGVRYHTPTGTVTPGTVTSAVQFTVRYP